MKRVKLTREYEWHSANILLNVSGDICCYSRRYRQRQHQQPDEVNSNDTCNVRLHVQNHEYHINP